MSEITKFSLTEIVNNIKNKSVSCEEVINAYINNMANQINVLTQENILLKTRLELAEKNAKDLQEQLNKEEEEDS